MSSGTGPGARDAPPADGAGPALPPDPEPGAGSGTGGADAAIPWHALAPGEVMARLETTADGLSPEQVAERHARFGLNVLPRRRDKPLVRVYLAQFASPLVYLLLLAAAVSAVIGEWTDAGFIFVVLQINAVIGTIQEWRAQIQARSLDSLIENATTLIRGGMRERVVSTDLVPGDIMVIEPGMRVAVDARLTASVNTRADESLLTGESLAVNKSAVASVPEHAGLGERIDMLHAGTAVVSGEGRAVVVETGARTQIGRIAGALTADAGEPPLVTRLKRFTNLITIVFAVVIALLAVAEVIRGTPAFEIFLTSVALAVAAVPEGLPVAITVALAIGTARMARRRVVVRLLPAVEGLGACTLVASDKTGTLTWNELTARRIWLPDGTLAEVTGGGYHVGGEVRVDGAAPAAGRLDALCAIARSGALCNDGGIHVRDGEVSHFGDGVDVALLILAVKLGIDPHALSRGQPRLAAIPFEAERRFAASVNRQGEAAVAHVKGAAETVLPMCAAADVAAVTAAEERLAAEGYRVLALARGPVEGRFEGDGHMPAETLRGLEFLGLVAFIDPLRPEAPEAVRQCRSAGVEVRMVTGDHPVTALSIARELGIVDGDEPAEGLVVTGARLQDLADDPQALARACARARVFARVEPMQKLMIVDALQKSGHFVAVTGDGVNDAPALRRANIGVAMGKSGTDVARDAADLILTDDRFQSIIDGMREGRIAYDNVRKVVYLLIATGAGEIVLFFLAIATGLPPPLFAVQLLWLNLVTNGVQDVALAFERGEPDVLGRPPRPPGQRIIDSVMMTQVGIAGAYIGIGAYVFFAGALAMGWTEAEARNATLLLMVLFENVHVFNCRSETRSCFRVPFAANPFVVLSVIAAQGLHIAAMHTPFMQTVLDVAPVAPGTWLTVAGIALGLLATMELFKWVWRRRRRP